MQNLFLIFFFYTCFYSHQQRKGTNRNKELFDRANDVNLIKVFVVKKIDVFDARAIVFYMYHVAQSIAIVYVCNVHVYIFF